MPSLIPVEDVRLAARFLRRLPAFLRHPVSLDEARATLRGRLAGREASFLGLVRRGVYEHAGSPYRKLLGLAGCEYGDLEKLVARDGVEGALQALLGQGVYLTVDEFKGRRPLIRGGTTIELDPSQLGNPLLTSHLPVRTGGSRSAGTPVLFDLAFIRDCAVNAGLVLDARGGADWLKADWEVPGGGAMFRLLKYSSFGAPPVGWFSQVDPAAPGLHPRYRWSGRVMRWGSLVAGVPLPRPVHVPLEKPLRIALWMTETLRAGGTPHLFTFPSSAVRLCQAALDAGVDLGGARLTVGGEPVTAARLATIRRAGAEAAPRYGSIECGPIGYGCLAPAASDDVHLLHDLHALISPGPDGPIAGLPGDALFVSSLRGTAPLILLNVSLGDHAVMTPRPCGCPLERLGWGTHLHTIRSYEKLTAGGMTFLDTDVIRVLEEVLPARFGGAPIDYQLLEEEVAGGQPRLRLLVHPVIGPVDSAAVRELFLTAVSAGVGAERVMGLLWREADVLHVERRAPLPTASGKVLHLHVERRSPRRPVPPPAG